MKRLSQAVFLSMTALVLNVQAAAPDNASAQAGERAREIWHQQIEGGYQTLSEKAGEFAEHSRHWCADPATGSRSDVEQAWQQAFMAWQAVRFVDFGPIETDNRAWQLQFWPDPKNLIARKARYLLSADQAPTTDTIAGAGVAVQGFPMAEYLLFDEPFNRGDQALPAERSCQMLTAVASHIAANSEQQLSDWRAFEKHYIASEQYQDASVRAGMNALEILEERRLAQPMGLRGTGKRSAYVADAWRSGKSLATVEATVRGLKTHYLPGLELLLENSGQPGLADRIRGQFNEVLENFPALDTPMAPLLADDREFSRLQGLWVDVSQLTTLVNDQAAVAVGVVRGFNSSDGD
ncbi:hypothetical protein SAMN05216429_101337 [Marinobacter persicus]|uniref:Imelysin-like domain-containing protein n=1 Tax=Marinobacter persicus TaxID=930118 RepID=A0A1I3PXP7_9GAMM|nr:imelysin family protein [Marinobacter persicus]GHD51969.1 lipoprotein [Marinobacter persicus]SFJ26092.1 hypothetical protein SAMN05216429_101337 [Marinobacter persicus]